MMGLRVWSLAVGILFPLTTMVVGAPTVKIAAANEGLSGDPIHTYVGSPQPYPNPERGFRLGLYHFPNVSADMRPQIPGKSGLDLCQENNFSMVVAYAYMDWRVGINYSRPLPEKYLLDLSNAFEKMREARVKCTMTFAFMLNETSPEPASYEVVFGYMDQLKPVIEKHADVIYALKAGFIGAYGEWHGGKLIKNMTGLAMLVAKELNDFGLPSDRYVLIRTSREKWDMVLDQSNSSGQEFPPTWVRAVTDSRTALSQLAHARLGYHDDGFMAFPGDGGTYVDGPCNDGKCQSTTCPWKTCEQKQGASDPNFPYYNYVTAESPWIVTDAEMYYGTPNLKENRNLVDGHDAAFRLRLHHTSTLSHVNSYAPYDGHGAVLSMNVWMNTSLNTTQLERWKMPLSPAYAAAAKNLTIYDYIRDHLGYRLELQSAQFPSTASRGGTFRLSFVIMNYGFAPPRNVRPLRVVLISKARKAIVFDTAVQQQGGPDNGLGGDSSDPRTWQPYMPGAPDYRIMQHSLTTHVHLPSTLPAGNYKLGLHLPDALCNRSDESKMGLEHHGFSIRFANDGMEWWYGEDGAGGVNILGQLVVNDDTLV